MFAKAKIQVGCVHEISNHPISEKLLICRMEVTKGETCQVESGLITTGASIFIDGVLVASTGSKQKVELRTTKLVLIGSCDAATFPVQKKKASREYLRSVAHMRPQTNTFGAVARVINALAYATHKFFQEMGFAWVASPIITTSDCEGA